MKFLIRCYSLCVKIGVNYILPQTPHKQIQVNTEAEVCVDKTGNFVRHIP